LYELPRGPKVVREERLRIGLVARKRAGRNVLCLLSAGLLPGV
jgi:hypothetical protein